MRPIVETSFGAPADAGAVLWIGADAWPSPDAAALHRRQESVGPWEGMELQEIKTGGLFCFYRKVVGIRFWLKEEDASARIAVSYSGTGFPGYRPPQLATSLEEVIRVRERLSEVGLILHPTKYPDFAEGYVPLQVESVWEYARMNALRVLLKPRYDVEPETCTLDEIGISSFEDLDLYMTQYWQLLQRSSSNPAEMEDPVWMGILTTYY